MTRLPGQVVVQREIDDAYFTNLLIELGDVLLDDGVADDARPRPAASASGRVGSGQ